MRRASSEAAEFIEGVRRGHADASHNVWAYVLADGQLRWSDDGEPGGTAGQPVLNVLRSAGVSDAVCVVTRYFGGIPARLRRPRAGILEGRVHGPRGRGKGAHGRVGLRRGRVLLRALRAGCAGFWRPWAARR